MEYEGRELEVLSNLDNYHDWIVDEMAPHIHGRVLEVGAGAGAISHRLSALADSLLLLEPCPALSAGLASRTGYDVVPESLEQYLERAPAGEFDTVVSVNVLEHIADDRSALRGLHGVLRPGGSLCLFVPALPALFSAFDRTVGHHRRYTRSGLEDAVRDSGFSVTHSQYFDSPGVLAWFVICKLLGQTEFRRGPIDLYDRWIVPTTRALETRLRPPLGKNLLLIATKG